MNIKMRTIAETLTALQGGTFADRCTDEMKELVKRVDQTGKAGKLTITIDLKKAGGALSIDAKVTTKTPEEKADSDLLWATVEGNLSLQNPAQRNLDLQDIKAPKTELVG